MNSSLHIPAYLLHPAIQENPANLVRWKRRRTFPRIFCTDFTASQRGLASICLKAYFNFPCSDWEIIRVDRSAWNASAHTFPSDLQLVGKSRRVGSTLEPKSNGELSLAPIDEVLAESHFGMLGTIAQGFAVYVCGVGATISFSRHSPSLIVDVEVGCSCTNPRRWLCACLLRSPPVRIYIPAH